MFNFKDLRINSIIVFKEDTNEVIAKIKESSFETREGFKILLDSYSEEKDESWLVKEKTIVYLKNNPSQTFLVSEANSRSFTLIKLTIVDDELALDNELVLTYPNNKMLYTLEDLGLVILNSED